MSSRAARQRSRDAARLGESSYVKRPGDDAYAPIAVDVLRIQEGAVAEIVTFGAEVFPAFELPRSI